MPLLCQSRDAKRASFFTSPIQQSAGISDIDGIQYYCAYQFRLMLVFVVRIHAVVELLLHTQLATHSFARRQLLDKPYPHHLETNISTTVTGTIQYLLTSSHRHLYFGLYSSGACVRDPSTHRFHSWSANV